MEAQTIHLVLQYVNGEFAQWFVEAVVTCWGSEPLFDLQPPHQPLAEGYEQEREIGIGIEGKYQKGGGVIGHAPLLWPSNAKHQQHIKAGHMVKHPDKAPRTTIKAYVIECQRCDGR